MNAVTSHYLLLKLGTVLLFFLLSVRTLVLPRANREHWLMFFEQAWCEGLSGLKILTIDIGMCIRSAYNRSRVSMGKKCVNHV